MKNLLLYSLFIALIVLGCEEDVTKADIDDIAANEFAQTGFDLLNEKLLDLEEPDNPQSGEDVFPEADYNQIKNLFEQALDENPDNALANFGMAVLELASVNYDEEFWDLIDDFDDELGEMRFFDNQFSLLARTPFIYMKYLYTPFRADEISLARIQNFIDDNIFPKIENALDHLSTAISLPDSVVIMIDTDEEILELDRAEIYAFRVGTFAISAAMRMFTLYDMDMFDEDGTYDWLDNMDQDDEECTYTYDPQTQDLIIEYHYLATNELQIFQMLNYNHTQRPGFMEFRDGQDPVQIQDDLINILTDLQNIVDYVSGETDSQDNDIIQYDYIVEMNDEIGEIDNDDPNFVQDWQTVDDIIDWVNTLLTEPVTFNEDIDDDGIEEELTLDLARLFNPGIEDMKDYLPYHQWLPESEWINEELDGWDNWYNGGGYFSFWCDGELVEIMNVNHVYKEYYEEWVEPLELLDAPDGNVIDPDDEFPYMPDYTMNGLFPNMTRDLWIELFEFGD